MVGLCLDEFECRGMRSVTYRTFLRIVWEVGMSVCLMLASFVCKVQVCFRGLLVLLAQQR